LTVAAFDIRDLLPAAANTLRAVIDLVNLQLLFRALQVVGGSVDELLLGCTTAKQ